MPVPTEPKIYHIAHVDRLPSIVAEGCLWSDVEAEMRGLSGTGIGNPAIKQRRRSIALQSHPGLHVGECVPFYFCPRSVMLYVLFRGNDPDLPYSGGQGQIAHLEADLHQVVRWAQSNGRRWAFTDANAATRYFEDYSDLSALDKIDWTAVEATRWAAPEVKEAKQAEFLVERSLPWECISFVGVASPRIRDRVQDVMLGTGHRPVVDVVRTWYY